MLFRIQSNADMGRWGGGAACFCSCRGGIVQVCDGLIGFNPHRRTEGPRPHDGTERPDRDSAQQQFDAIRGRKFASEPQRHD